MEFGAVSSEQRGNAWVRVKRELRSLQRSEHVPRGVRGSQWAWVQNMGLDPLSFPSSLQGAFTDSSQNASQGGAAWLPLANWNGKQSPASGKITPLFKNKRCCAKTDCGKGWSRCVWKDHACLMAVEAAAGCSLHSWLKADTRIKAHEYSVTK